MNYENLPPMSTLSWVIVSLFVYGTLIILGYCLYRMRERRKRIRKAIREIEHTINNIMEIVNQP